MKYLRIGAVGAVAFAGLGAYAQVIDQNQPSNPNYMAAFSQTDLAQSFQQANNNIDGAGIFTQANVGGGDTITISLYDALPNAGGNLLTSGSVSNTTAGAWYDVFWSPVSVTPNTTYFLVFTSDTNTEGIAGDVNNPYSRGQVYANAGYGSFPNFDYTFRTYTAAPEPASLAVLGIGALVAIRRRRKQTS